MDKQNKSRTKPDFHFEAYSKQRFATFIVCILVPFMILQSIIAFLEGHILFMLLNTVIAGGIVISVIVSRTLFTQHINRIYLIITILILPYLIYLLVDNNGESSRAFWTFIYPVTTLFLLGRRQSKPWLISFFIFLVLYLFVPLPFLRKFPLTTFGKIRFFGSFAIVTALSYAFISIRDRFSHELETRNFILEGEKEKLVQATHQAGIAREAKSKFLAAFSHKLRTPLNHIIGFTELVSDERIGTLNPKQREYLGDVLESANHLLSLINDILDLSRIESGKMEISPGPVHLESIVSWSIDMVNHKALTNNITISAVTKEAPEYITGDEQKLKRILFNLISNAVKFSYNGGEVIVEYGKAADGDDDNPSLFIHVKDFGTGIAPEDRLQIFESFVQVDSSASRRQQGTGLGLAMTKHLVELHGGTISVKSKGHGKGSTFTVVLPLNE